MKKFLFTYSLIFIVITVEAQDAYREIMSVRDISFKGENRGVAIGDYDNDGDEDIYISIANGANQLYKNLGNDQFVDVAATAGVNFGGGSRMAVWGDLNNDGHLDLYLANYNINDVLYMNNGDGTFSNITINAGINNFNLPLSVNMCDVDLDGFLDVYVANFRAENVLYHNNGNLTFTNYIYPSNARDDKHSMGAVFFDYDNDGDSDLYLTHDGGVPNILYQNNGKGYFTDVSAQAGVNYSGQGMGTDFGDFNNDGFFDIYITNLFENVLYVNNGDGTFTNIAASAGVDDKGMGWSCNFLDFDNDGRQDIYVANDSYFSPYANVLYKNLGDSKFEKISQSVAASMRGTYGSACGDFNRDGFVDIAIANSGTNDFNQIFQNTGNANNWIGFKLEGMQSNRSAVGARVIVTDANGIKQMDEVTAGSGFGSQNSLKLHFGLADSKTASTVKVNWPSGLQQEFTDLESGFYYKIVEGATPEKLENTITSAEEIAFKRISNVIISPNPADEEVNIQFELWESAAVEISVWNAQGQQIQVLSSGQLAQGPHLLTWKPGTEASPGVYFVKMASAEEVWVRKVMVR